MVSKMSVQKARGKQIGSLCQNYLTTDFKRVTDNSIVCLVVKMVTRNSGLL